MLTIHTADVVLSFPAGPTPVGLPGGAVAVEGSLIAEAGPYEKIVARYEGARVRRWPGMLMPGLFNRCGAQLLESAYHPDPREAETLGTEPLTGDALEALGIEADEERWGASARRGLQRMLRNGTTALQGPFTRPTVRAAVERSGLAVLQHPLGSAGTDPTFDVLTPRPLTLGAVVSNVLAEGSRADFAVFDLPGGAEGRPALEALCEVGTGACVATVLGGRLVYRGK